MNSNLIRNLIKDNYQLTGEHKTTLDDILDFLKEKENGLNVLPGKNYLGRLISKQFGYRLTKAQVNRFTKMYNLKRINLSDQDNELNNRKTHDLISNERQYNTRKRKQIVNNDGELIGNANEEDNLNELLIENSNYNSNDYISMNQEANQFSDTLNGQFFNNLDDEIMANTFEIKKLKEFQSYLQTIKPNDLSGRQSIDKIPNLKDNEAKFYIDQLNETMNRRKEVENVASIQQMPIHLNDDFLKNKIKEPLFNQNESLNLNESSFNLDSLLLSESPIRLPNLNRLLSLKKTHLNESNRSLANRHQDYFNSLIPLLDLISNTNLIMYEKLKLKIHQIIIDTLEEDMRK